MTNDWVLNLGNTTTNTFLLVINETVLLQQMLHVHCSSYHKIPYHINSELINRRKLDKKPSINKTRSSPKEDLPTVAAPTTCGQTSTPPVQQCFFSVKNLGLITKGNNIATIAREEVMTLLNY
jgi:hypothetical protein